MDGRIGHLHCGYQFIGRRDTAALTADHLSRLARHAATRIYADALDQVLGDDPTVYVVRRVRSSLLLNPAENLNDEQLARKWGERLARDVLRLIHANAGDDVICFASQAEYVARFLSDLLRGKAWSRWYYAVFGSLRSLDPAEAVHECLLDNRAHLPEILGCLERDGVLEKILASLEPQRITQIWADGLAMNHAPGPESLRPLFAAAFDLIGRAALWAKPPAAAKSLFEAYLSSRPPPPADWSDPKALAAGVLDCLRYLARHGYLRCGDGESVESILLRLSDRLLPELDWLDTDWLKEALPGLIGPSATVDADLPARRTGSRPTPRQRDLMQALITIIQQRTGSLDRTRPDSPANGLRLYAMLVHQAPHWAGDPLVGGMIQRLLNAWACLAGNHAMGAAIARLRAGDIPGASRELPPRAGQKSREVLHFLAGLGDTGLEVLNRLTDGGPRDAPANGGVASACAGIFLLLRTILDLGIPGLVKTLGYPAATQPAPFAALVAVLGLRWAGDNGMCTGRLDPGLRIMTGRKDEPTLESLRRTWSATRPEDHLQFQAALLRVLAGQRILKGAVMHLYHVNFGGRTALVAGDETAMLWPLGRCLAADDEWADIVAAWVEAWKAATGAPPVIVTGQEPDLPAGKPGAPVLPPGSPQPASNQGDGPGMTPWRQGRDALLKALAALDHGSLGLPDTDLSLNLAAMVLLRAWARWLHRFAASSVPYLLENFIRRPGWIHPGKDGLRVEMENRPLDVVLEMAGYTADLEAVSWLGQGRVRFQIRG